MKKEAIKKNKKGSTEKNETLVSKNKNNINIEK